MSLTSSIIADRLNGLSLRFPVSGDPVTAGSVVICGVSAARTYDDPGLVGYARTYPLSAACLRLLLADQDYERKADSRIRRFPCRSILTLGGFDSGEPDLKSLDTDAWRVGATRRLIEGVFAEHGAICCVAGSAIPDPGLILCMVSIVEAVGPRGEACTRSFALSRIGAASLATDPALVELIEARDETFYFHVATSGLPAACPSSPSPCGC